MTETERVAREMRAVAEGPGPMGLVAAMDRLARWHLAAVKRARGKTLGYVETMHEGTHVYFQAISPTPDIPHAMGVIGRLVLVPPARRRKGKR